MKRKAGDDQSTSGTHQLIGIDRLCQLLDIGKNTAYSLLINGKVKAFKVGSVWKIPIKEVDYYIEHKCRPSQSITLYSVINQNRDLYYERTGRLPILVN